MYTLLFLVLLSSTVCLADNCTECGVCTVAQCFHDQPAFFVNMIVTLPIILIFVFVMVIIFNYDRDCLKNIRERLTKLLKKQSKAEEVDPNAVPHSSIYMHDDKRYILVPISRDKSVI